MIHNKITESIRQIDAVKIASDLVKIPSYSFKENQEKETAEYIYNLFQKEGISAELIEVLPGRYNINAVIPGSGEGKSLMLSGHLDTVPAYDMKDPFSGMIQDGRLHGRGSCDMKGPLAAMIAAVIGIKRSGVKLKGDLYFIGVIDEEESGKGIEYIADNGPYTDGAVIGEPTAMKLARGQKGLEWIRITILGRKVHGGKMEQGINAIEMAGRLINRIYSGYVPELRKREHPILGFPTINIGKIEGGDQPSTVPGSCILEIDRRWVLGENIEQVYDELKDIIDEMHESDNRFNAEIKGFFTKDEILPHKPFITDDNDPLVKSIEKVMNEAGYFSSELTVFPAWSDAGVLAEYTNTKCVVMGPGDITSAHSDGECIETEDMKEAALIYGLLAADYCGTV